MKKRGEKVFHFNFPKNKRALSAVVANLLIILLVLVSIGIIWVVVRNIINQGSEDVDINRFSLDLSITNAYIDDTGAEDVVDVAVRRSPGGSDITGIVFVFFDGSNSVNIQRNVALQELEERTFTFTDEEIGVIADAEEVSVAPVFLASGNEERIGGITDTAQIRSSPPPGLGGGGGEGPVCGNDLCESGETSSNCPADCSPGGPVCGNDLCESGETSSNCPADCFTPISCDGAWNQTDIDDGNECDGGGTPGGVLNCQSTCICETGFGPDGSGGCDLDPPLDTGIINSVWNNIYLDSENLPKSSAVTAFIGDYVNFTASSEIGCFLITFADYISENDISYIRVDDSLGVPNINPGEGYSVWEADNCGQ